ncbi:MAG: winged helix-turn-helix domain-containing protein [Eubacteriales bacterium]|nr:winged helix-turn-helix domain-containing protein [Eubacteriales bacterium]
MDKLMAVLSDEQEMEQVSVPDSSILTFQELKILPRRRQVYINNREVSLTTREFDVLYHLARYAGQVLTARQIYEAVSRESAAGCDYHCIESSIYSIRKKLGRDVILTVRGYGYKFNWK